MCFSEFQRPFSMTQKCICLDGEGVIWHSGKAIPGSTEVISQMKALGFRTIVITNNASRSSEQYVERFVRNGYNDFSAKDVITSAVTVANRLIKLRFHLPGRKVFVLGTDGFVSQLTRVNINVVTPKDFEGIDIHEMELDPEICAVVVGSSEEFSYIHLTIATRFVIENDATLFSANPDASYPYNGKVLVPGAYSLAKCIGSASNREPIALGKPSPEMLQSVEGYKDIDIKNSWMIGDRINTDISFAKQAGLKSILVLTGVTREEEIAMIDPLDRPDFVCKDLQECLEIIKKN